MGPTIGAADASVDDAEVVPFAPGPVAAGAAVGAAGVAASGAGLAGDTAADTADASFEVAAVNAIN